MFSIVASIVVSIPMLAATTESPERPPHKVLAAASSRLGVPIQGLILGAVEGPITLHGLGIDVRLAHSDPDRTFEKLPRVLDEREEADRRVHGFRRRLGQPVEFVLRGRIEQAGGPDGCQSGWIPQRVARHASIHPAAVRSCQTCGAACVRGKSREI